MPIDKAQANGHVETPSRVELARMIDNGEWEKVKELLTPSPEEVEQILNEPMVDAAEVYRRLKITDDEIAEARKSPPPEIFPPAKKGHK